MKRCGGYNTFPTRPCQDHYLAYVPAGFGDVRLLLPYTAGRLLARYPRRINANLGPLLFATFVRFSLSCPLSDDLTSGTLATHVVRRAHYRRALYTTCSY